MERREGVSPPQFCIVLWLVGCCCCCFSFFFQSFAQETSTHTNCIMQCWRYDNTVCYPVYPQMSFVLLLALTTFPTPFILAPENCWLTGWLAEHNWVYIKIKNSAAFSFSAKNKGRDGRGPESWECNEKQFMTPLLCLFLFNNFFLWYWQRSWRCCWNGIVGWLKKLATWFVSPPSIHSTATTPHTQLKQKNVGYSCLATSQLLNREPSLMKCGNEIKCFVGCLLSVHPSVLFYKLTVISESPDWLTAGLFVSLSAVAVFHHLPLKVFGRNKKKKHKTEGNIFLHFSSVCLTKLYEVTQHHRRMSYLKHLYYHITHGRNIR